MRAVPKGEAKRRNPFDIDPGLDHAATWEHHTQAMRRHAEGWHRINTTMMESLKPLLPAECFEVSIKDPTLFYWQCPIPGITARDLLELAAFETERRIPKIRDQTTRRMRTATRFEAMCLYLQMDRLELSARLALCRLR